MPKTTYEEAQSCPKCGQYGEHVATNPGPRDSKVETYHCKNEVCLWYGGSGWIVQVNRDGSIPERKKGMKEFPVLPDSQRQVFDDYLAALKAADEGAH